jgi:hypothetical protein
MKQLFYLSAILCVVCGSVASCKDDGYPGDFNIKPTLAIIPEVTSLHGDTIALTQIRSIDSTYRYFYLHYDTLKDEGGEPVIGGDGKLVIAKDTVWYYSKITAKFTEYALVELPSTADTFTIRLQSNAKWNAPIPDRGDKVQWYYNYNLITGGTTTSGGGDGMLNFRVTRNKNYRRPVTAVQDIMTSDSSVLVRLRFTQRGEKDQ